MVFSYFFLEYLASASCIVALASKNDFGLVVGFVPSCPYYVPDGLLCCSAVHLREMVLFESVI